MGLPPGYVGWRVHAGHAQQVGSTPSLSSVLGAADSRVGSESWLLFAAVRWLGVGNGAPAAWASPVSVCKQVDLMLVGCVYKILSYVSKYLTMFIKCISS